MIDVSLDRVDVDGVLFERAADAGADDINDTWFWNDGIFRAEGVRWAVVSQQSIVFSMVGREEKSPVDSTGNRVVNNIRLKQSDPRTHRDLFLVFSPTKKR